MSSLRSDEALGHGVATDGDLVFVVDDDRGMRETVVDILDIAGISARGAASAESAREMIGELQPSLVVVDQRLPDGSGIDLGEELKEQDPDRPVLLLTGYATMENAIDAVGKVDDYLVKPIQPEQLLKAIRAGLERSRLRRHNRMLLEELRQANSALETIMVARTTELTGLVTMAEATAHAISVVDVVRASVKTMCLVAGARSAALYVSSEELNALELIARHGTEWGVPVALYGTLEPHLNSLAAAAGDRIEGVSLEAGGRRAGVVLLRDPATTNRPFLRTLGAQIAVAIQNAQRFERERETVERLSELSRMESMFLASVSHELRTPLTAVLGFAQLLRSNDEALTVEERREMLDYVNSQSQRLNRLVNDVLDATRLKSLHFAVTTSPIAIGPLLRQAAETVRANHEVVLDVPDDLPNVLGDFERVEQVIANLVQNAAKYSEQGTKIRVSAEVDGDHVVVSVADQGLGIDPEFIPHVFDSFSQARTGDTRRDAGLGLGLYITKGLVEAMGGAIDVSSVPGAGSTFEVSFLLAETAA